MPEPTPRAGELSPRSSADAALALVELDSLARGYRCLDALIKQAPVRVLEANLVEPGKFLVLFAGGVAEVEESFAVARCCAGESLVDAMFLPDAHPAIPAALRGAEVALPADQLDALGMIEGRTVAGALRACDASLKNADVRLAGLRVAGALGGRGWYLVYGAQHDVEAAIAAGEAALGAALHRAELVARPHPEMAAWLLRPAPFAVR